MAHPAQQIFCLEVKKQFPEHFIGKYVLDVGSMDINGTNKDLFSSDCRYIGVDIAPGKNVDIVSKGHELTYPDGEFDTIISTECLEHDMYWKSTLANMVRMLKPSGLLLLTCATGSRAEHGTARCHGWASATSSASPEWSNYYKNLSRDDVLCAIDVNANFNLYNLIILNDEDLQFWGIKNV